VVVIVPVFGRGFRPTVDLGLLLLPGAAAVGLASVVSAAVVGRGKPSYSLYNSLVMTPVTVAMYATLIPWLGATGAALGSTLSYLGSFVIVCAFYRHMVGRSVLRTFVPTVSEVADLCGLLGRIARLRRPASL
jgi:O-antigen/teichoic acid export membrane protein